MPGWELFLIGLAVGNMLGTWAAQKQMRKLEEQFDEAMGICERYATRQAEIRLRAVSRRNEEICQPKEN